MTFEEMQLLLQSIAVSQRETNAIVKEITAGLQETKKVVDSNSCAIQAMLDQAATDRLNHEARMEKLERLSEGLINMLS
jgi:hypothetical protein